MSNPRRFIELADISDIAPMGAERVRDDVSLGNSIDVNALPDGVVTGTTLIDLSNVQSPEVRSGISLSMLFASRVATAKAPPTEDAWLAEYQSALAQLGFSVGGTSEIHSRFKKLNVAVHEAIIPFLTIAFGGATVGPVILALLENLKSMSADSPWITAFDRQVKRYDAQEMHFAAAIPNGNETQIRYVIARLHLKELKTQVLFFKINKSEAEFESATTTMTASNSLLAVNEAALQTRLSELTKKYIWEAAID